LLELGQCHGICYGRPCRVGANEFIGIVIFNIDVVIEVHQHSECCRCHWGVGVCTDLIRLMNELMKYIIYSLNGSVWVTTMTIFVCLC